MKRLIICILLLLLTLPLAADPNEDPTAYPTVQALEETLIPYADPVELARRLRSIDEFSLPAARTEREIGEQEQFHTSDAQIVTATLQTIGEHIYFWVEDGARVRPGGLRALAKVFDEEIYPAMHELWGSEASPGVDGDVRLHALFSRNLGPTTAAYFARRHTFPDEVYPGSNEREMFFINVDAYGSNVAIAPVESVLAHEFQHMIRYNLDPNEDTWLNEAFSTFTERYLGYTTPFDVAAAFLLRPGTQLNTFGLEDTPRAVNYGAGFTFLTYFYERYGIEAMTALSDDPANGLVSVDNVLQSLGEPGVDEFFADWVLATWIQDTSVADGQYGYDLLPFMLRPLTRDAPGTYPYTNSGEINQYATAYYDLRNFDDFESLTITLTAPETAQLVPVEQMHGQQAWYSNRGDVSNMTLTRAFDLTDVDNATLNYDIWYAIEPDWDYGYLVVSTDGGEDWDILSTPHTTTENPQNNSYGSAYTGYSHGWINESVSLDVYAGQEILLRFEMITDDAVNLSGILIDDVSIPEIDYSSGFEQDGGGWESAGWVLTDNTLPQHTWLQVIQTAGDDVSITRWLAPDETTRTVPLVDDVEQVVLAVSPFAPLTTVPLPFTLEITGN